MTHRGTDEWLVVVVVCLSGIRAAEGLTCTVHPQGDGSALYQISAPAKPNREYDWKINGMVVAHEDDSDGTIVLKHNGTFLLLKAHHSNTTYTVDTAERMEHTRRCRLAAVTCLLNSTNTQKEKMRGARGVHKQPLRRARGVHKHPLRKARGVHKHPLRGARGVHKHPLRKARGVHKQPL
ncbi:uncharacterized protein LOC116222395 isoform X3 [Clupea harengus]|uniref:Uncharacterized protein LOC116222395 isoform X3 n=1 Tax=Clupea harengus TaxID=7950 RepID=A0A6P8GAB9_CLUHA|nr:uncharacterized protein LOC116222395 isoform X3 [Clupea harengus]